MFSYDPKLLLPPGGDTQEAEMQTVPETQLHYTVLYYDIGKDLYVFIYLCSSPPPPDCHLNSVLTFALHRALL